MDMLDKIYFSANNLIMILMFILIIYVSYLYLKYIQNKEAEERNRIEKEEMRNAVIQYDRERDQFRENAVRLMQTIERLERQNKELTETTKNALKRINEERKRMQYERDNIASKIKISNATAEDNDIDIFKVIGVAAQVITGVALGFAAFRGR